MTKSTLLIVSLNLAACAGIFMPLCMVSPGGMIGGQSAGIIFFGAILLDVLVLSVVRSRRLIPRALFNLVFWVCVVISLIPGIWCCLAALDLNPQGAIADQETGQIDYVELLIIFFSWFLWAFPSLSLVVFSLLSCGYLRRGSDKATL